MTTELEMVKALAELADDPQPLTLEMPKLDAWILMGVIQLALRHPGFRGHSASNALKLARRIEAALATNAPLRELAARGYDGSFDVTPAGDIQAPRPSKVDVQEIGRIVCGHADHFSAHLFRLIKKADAENRRRIAAVYPHHVRALAAWEGGGG